MKKIITLLLAFSFINLSAQTSIFNNLLQKHVDKKGNVAYADFKKDEQKLDQYLEYLKETSPNNSWSANEEKAFWINAYNAYTIKLILQNYPLQSIMNIKEKGKTAWKIPFAKVGGKTYTLDHIEHEILRKKFKDPKIHVGVNCASFSCPKLSNIAFTEENIDSQLEQLMKDFINDENRNKLSAKKVQISSIFDWFKGDFTQQGTVNEYLNKYANIEINKRAKIRYLKYNWQLNEK